MSTKSLKTGPRFLPDSRPYSLGELGQGVNLTKPQFPHLGNRDNSGANLIQFLERLDDIINKVFSIVSCIYSKQLGFSDIDIYDESLWMPESTLEINHMFVPVV